jgi:7-cyano-7-deazaguanine synthase
MDSFTLVTETHDAERLHSCLSFDYGQRHNKELAYAMVYCRELDIPHHIIDLRSLTKHMLGSALTDDVAVPEGHYAEETMKLTVVPSRNMIMLAVASAYAVSHKLSRVLFGAHAGDHAIYPDCRPEFVAAMNVVTLLGNWHPVMIEAPYLTLTKRDILLRGFAIDPHLDYGKSWTCYKGNAKPCGVCGSCQERLEAFRLINRRDPLEYAQ